jgi:hypothetical protein
MRAFTGYSDDIVYSATSRKDMDEYYSEHYLLSDGSTVRAKHGDNGWEFSSTNADAILIGEVDTNDEGIRHADERIPSWLEPHGYSPVLLIPGELEIIADGNVEFDQSAKDDIPIFVFLRYLCRESGLPMDELPCVDDIKSALVKSGICKEDGQ